MDIIGQPWTGKWRREWDSNPRWAFDPYSLSRGAPSTARPSLHTFEKLRNLRLFGKNAILRMSGTYSGN